MAAEAPRAARHRRDHGLPGAGDVLCLDRRVRRPGRPDEPHPPLLGLGFALLILPVSLGTTALIILLNGALWAPAVARVLDTSLRYTIDKTTREVLFLPLPTDLKYRAKPFVDVTVDRFAKALGALLLLVLIKPWGLNLDWQRAELSRACRSPGCGSSMAHARAARVSGSVPAQHRDASDARRPGAARRRRCGDHRDLVEELATPRRIAASSTPSTCSNRSTSAT